MIRGSRREVTSGIDIETVRKEIVTAIGISERDMKDRLTLAFEEKLERTTRKLQEEIKTKILVRDGKQDIERIIQQQKDLVKGASSSLIDSSDYKDLRQRIL